LISPDLEAHLSKRTIPLAAAAMFALTLAPVYARPVVVAQQTAKHANSLFLKHGLTSGHMYRLEVTSKGHHHVFGYGFEYYTYISNHSLYAGNRSLTVRGTTPTSVTFSQPIGNKLAEWDFAVNVQIQQSHTLTLRLFDLGKHK
jgi:hypothetical protein